MPRKIGSIPKVTCVDTLLQVEKYHNRETFKTIEEDKRQEDLHHRSQLHKSYEITIITPIFGGGIFPGKVNAAEPVRSSSVRGHLRFWWRATRGATSANAQDLKKREAEIFGDTSRPSKIKLWVESYKDKPKRTSDKLPSYALFPFNNETKKTSVEDGYMRKFKLHIQLDVGESGLLVSDIEPALWAWINFGGIGARTRRGCGSLYCEKFSPPSECTKESFVQWFENKVGEYKLELLESPDTREWPTLSKRFEVAHSSGSNITSWSNSIEAYRNFRSRANKGGKKRSFWPEADTIRHLTKMTVKKHQDPFPEKPKDLIAFPRAEFGLPIIYQFNPKDNNQGNGSEPFRTTLQPKDKSRLASLLILKAVAISENKGFGIFLVLNQPRLKEIELIKNGGGRGWERKFDAKHIYSQLDYLDTPMKDLDGNLYCSAIDAFMNSEEVNRFCGMNNNQTKRNHK
ncbi:type III-B CRISPR module RAMP protein Cmr1 [Bacillus sp. FJAT-27264]|uniref:type III-B CRISPR module RAMP protein Cmr1 n=1 Tax=Paenibacillus sp. (strain DSM 101736 / FJAT-27264) TaxID=1850362 RepID=UPI000807E21E|nr:type III-B CRISPR module RAMP protein Cmr1 [Bacillus sp. FJAT-27264]OBZ15725.1 type III-B CRISPR module RAMP protein Cmr1 [Bacillus sp. FJAT-27264]